MIFVFMTDKLQAGTHNFLKWKIWTYPIPEGCVCAILHTTTNFWTTGDTQLKFYMVIDIHKLFPKIEEN